MNPLEQVYRLLTTSHPICTDSRNVGDGSVFVALKGDSFDGNKFALDAIEKGATLAVVDSQNLKGYPNTLFVPSTLTFLQDLARFYRSKLNIPIIALTGSNGKTTTKELINTVLSVKYRTCATQGNLNNHIGVPLTLLSIRQDAEIAIVELGANHIGEIAFLCSIAQPTYGLITNVGKAHLEGFGSEEGVKQGKSELYQFLAKDGGPIFLDNDNPILKGLADKHGLRHRICYGFSSFHTHDVSSSQSYLSFKISYSSIDYDVTTQLVGSYNIENILAAIRVGEHFGVKLVDAIKAIGAYKPTNNRSQIMQTSQNTLILDAYNANPSSMELAIRNFAELVTDKPKLAILGEMLELGDYAQKEHTRIARMALQCLQNVYLVGQNYSSLKVEAQWFPSQTDLAKYIQHNPLLGHTILLKGSRGVRLDDVVKYL